MPQVQAINAFSDNYIWCISNHASSCCALVDPGDADVCIEYLLANNLILDTLLITHHHHDHTGGIAKLKKYAKQRGWSISIYGPASEAIESLDYHLKQNDEISIFNGELTFNVIDLPGHTLGHIAYYGNDLLFCGDTLFSGGCGRLFEGTAQQMYQSIAKLASLNNETQVYCAHEYTLENLKFARTIEPNNSQLTDYYEKVVQLRRENVATIPTNIGLEKSINPFLRTSSLEVAQSAQQNSTKKLQNNVEIFATIRGLKDKF